jgi:hypothetical protein
MFDEKGCEHVRVNVDVDVVVHLLVVGCLQLFENPVLSSS